MLTFSPPRGQEPPDPLPHLLATGRSPRPGAGPELLSLKSVLKVKDQVSGEDAILSIKSQEPKAGFSW